jgi:hypothetical protein
MVEEARTDYSDWQDRMNRLRRVPILRRVAVLEYHHHYLGSVAWEEHKVQRMVGHVLNWPSCLVAEDHNSADFADNMPLMADVVAVEEVSFVVVAEECKLVVCLLGRRQTLSFVGMISIYMTRDKVITTPLIPLLYQ